MRRALPKRGSFFAANVQRRTAISNLSDKELDAVCGGWGFSIRTGSVAFVSQKNDSDVTFSAFTWVQQSNNINTGVQVQ